MTLPVQDKKVSVYKCRDYTYPEVKKAVVKMGEDLFGGWKACIPPGAKVLLKPNLLTAAPAEKAVSPHPFVVRAVAEACREAGAGKIIIGDSPGFGTALKVAAKCGILDVAQELGIDVVDFSESITVPTTEAFLHRSFSIAREVAEADLIINLPKFKTHAMMVITLAVKNLYGTLVGKQKARWHLQCGRDYAHFARLLIELAYTVKPAVSILDAIVGMEGNGPQNGTPRNFGFLAASKDMLSLDRVAVDIAGISPEQVPTLQVARTMGFDTALEHIQLYGDAPGDLKIDGLKHAAHMHVEGPLFFRMLIGLVRPYMTTQPYVKRMSCKGCLICMKACPAESIFQSGPGKPVSINNKTCIRCFCCQELCPEGAITAQEAFGVRLMKALGLG